MKAVLQKVILVLLSCLLHSESLMQEANARRSMPNLETSKSHCTVKTGDTHEHTSSQTYKY